MWVIIASLIGVAFLAFYLAGIWIDYTDGCDDDGLTDRFNDTLERELSEYGASEGSDGRHA
jgi:hypothetical protein